MGGLSRATSDREARLLRIRSQHIYRAASAASSGVSSLLRDVCSIQAQDQFAALLAIRARTEGLLATDVERARVQERSIVRSWSMRGTLHLLATEDLGWLAPLLGPRFIRLSRRRYNELGLREDVCNRAADIIHEALRDEGPLTRAELGEHLALRGVPTQGQAAYHLVRHAALRGLIVFGPDRGREPTYVALGDWAPTLDAMERDAALAELARRYLDAYGPATPRDLAAWSGLTLRDARVGFGGLLGELVEVQVAGESMWLPQSRHAWLDEPAPDLPVVRMLAEWDGYLLGYRSRDLALDPEYQKRVHPGAGMIRPTILVDGHVQGRWRRQQTNRGLTAEIDAFRTMRPGVRQGLDAEIADMARFLEMDVTIGTLADP